MVDVHVDVDVDVNVDVDVDVGVSVRHKPKVCCDPMCVQGVGCAGG